MNVVFRADASIDIGTGHVMRCLTLAEALREGGSHCRFVCRNHEGNLFRAIRNRGFDLAKLPVDPSDMQDRPDRLGYAGWLGANWQDDAQQTLRAIGEPIEWLVVDHYAIDANWERMLRQVCKSIMTIDDLANRRHDCDLLLDQNLGRLVADYGNLVSADCNFLIGPQNALLRPEFAEWRTSSLGRRAAPSLKRLLISMGGIDKDNVTGKVLAALRRCLLPQSCEISVVMGSGAPALENVRNSVAEMPWETKVLVDVQNMAELLAGADLAIGAAGGSSWERCCLGLPAICIMLADNQREVASALQAAGAVLLLGDVATIEHELPQCFSEIGKQGKLLAMQEACSAITDGMGTGRVAQALLDSVH